MNGRQQVGLPLHFSACDCQVAATRLGRVALDSAARGTAANLSGRQTPPGRERTAGVNIYLTFIPGGPMAAVAM